MERQQEAFGLMRGEEEHHSVKCLKIVDRVEWCEPPYLRYHNATKTHDHLPRHNFALDNERPALVEYDEEVF